MSRRITISVPDQDYQQYLIYKQYFSMSGLCQQALRIKIISLKGAKTKISNEERLLTDIRRLVISMEKIAKQTGDDYRKKKLNRSEYKELEKRANLKKVCRVCRKMFKTRDLVCLDFKDDKNRDQWVCEGCSDFGKAL